MRTEWIPAMFDAAESPSPETMAPRPVGTLARSHDEVHRPEKLAAWYGYSATRPHSAAVMIPCFNEETAIGKVVTDFRAALPDAVIYVYDNNSTDRTIAVARAAGAVVRSEPLQG